MGDVIHYRPAGEAALGARLFPYRGYLLAPLWLAALCWAQPWSLPGAVVGVGWLLLLLGLLWRCWAVAAWLAGGRGKVETERLLRHEGPYRFSRNPRYLGNLLMAIGTCLVAALPHVLPLFIVAWAGVHLPIVQTEEAFLLERFGGQFAQYCGEVPRWLSWHQSWASLGRQVQNLNWTGAWLAERQTQAGWLSLAGALAVWRDWKLQQPISWAPFLVFAGLWAAIEFRVWRGKRRQRASR